ncbi:C4-dicarboxylate ABC transporter permease [Nitrincola tibetensis]|uniref:TRAP transporter small permease protein n=1 Tax=Nitrincola tibetensis TaxID=2219697 RepID=A0A364NJD4_9GAMM|nr:TRAP transporter small permease subunit [Nitrincola tibetensis]RAU17130.1 C4-dicarboxylate ABC transporter permease [Nitrincola tibetensis]
MLVVSFLVRLICRINLILGNIFSWFSLGIVLTCFTVVVLRYFFSTGYVWMQDLYVWLNGMMFMGIAGFTLMQNGHVRVDIFYRPANARRKAIIDMIGCIVFVTPFLYIVTTYGLPYVQRSWRFMEGSSNFGGMPGLYIVKSFILVFVGVVALQAIAMVMRSVLILSGREDLVPEHYRYKEGG